MYFINLKRAVIVILIAVLSIVVICLGMNAGVSNFLPVSAQDNKTLVENSQTKHESVSRENMTFKNLSSLLGKEEIAFDETSLLPAQVSESETIHIRLDSTQKKPDESEISEQKPETNSLQLIKSKTSSNPLTRQRSFDLSPTQILIVFLNEQKQVLWWDLQPNPRIFRAETADEGGNLSGKTLYRLSADMLITFPADQKITDVFLYSPEWDGQTYSLELIGKINRSSFQKVKQ